MNREVQLQMEAEARLKGRLKHIMSYAGIEPQLDADDILNLFQEYIDAPEEQKDNIFAQGIERLLRTSSYQAVHTREHLHISDTRVTKPLGLKFLFVLNLTILYDAEHRFLEAYQEMLAQLHSSTMKSLLQEHIRQTEQQIQNLEQVHSALGEKPKRIKCDAAAGLVTEGQMTMKEVSGNPALLDSVIAGAVFKIEHYEIAIYRGLIEAARLMGQNLILQLLQQNLQQEEQTAQRVEQNISQLVQLTLMTHARSGGA